MPNLLENMSIESHVYMPRLKNSSLKGTYQDRSQAAQGVYRIVRYNKYSFLVPISTCYIVELHKLNGETERIVIIPKEGLVTPCILSTHAGLFFKLGSGLDVGYNIKPIKVT